MAPNQRKLKTKTLEEKVKILKDVDEKRLTRTQIMIKYDLPKSTLATYIANRDAIFKGYNSGKYAKKQKSMKAAAHPKLEESLITWLKMVRSKNIPIDGKIIKEQADKYALQLGIENFKASDGWLTRFKFRKQLVTKRICGESSSVDRDITKSWQETRLKEIQEEFQDKDIFNADETGLFYKLMPEKTVTFADDPASGTKKQKQRITVMVCANNDGSEKIPLLIIGNFLKPRCFKGLKSLPAEYRANRKAWMTAEIFEEWVRKLDKKFKRENRKICLLVDNCTAHSDIENLEAIKLEFFPVNCTSVLQPMDQGVIQAMKARYRKSVCQRILLCIENGKDYEIDLLRAMHTIVHCWNALSKETIANCFKHAGFKRLCIDENSSESEEKLQEAESNAELDSSHEIENTHVSVSDDPEGEHVFSELKKRGFNMNGVNSFQEFTNVDTNLVVSEDLTDDAIVASVLGAAEAEDRPIAVDGVGDVSDDDIDQPPEPKPSSANVLKALDVVRRYLQYEDNSESLLSKVYDIEAAVVFKRCNSLVQKSVTDYFKKA